MSASTPGVDERMERPGTPEELRATLARLIDDPVLRLQRGTALERAIRDRHQAEGWRDEARRVYAHASSSSPVLDVPATERRTGALEEMVRLVVTRSPYSTGVPGALRANLGHLPVRQRAAAAFSLMRAGTRPQPVDLVGDRAASTLRLARGRVRGWYRDRGTT